ncbi:MAG: hypothetical protein QOD63_470 [Actinomycetota bacterium]|jgi:hypothetical protein|nr:hypothetical protein [Actinomycetota bacterium]
MEAMTMTVEVPEPLAGRLAAEAARRGVSVDEVAVEALEGVYGPVEPSESGYALEAFIGCGSSGRSDPFDIARARSDLAARKLAHGA